MQPMQPSYIYALMREQQEIRRAIAESKQALDSKRHFRSFISQRRLNPASLINFISKITSGLEFRQNIPDESK